jgi:NADP-dependent 3-hydroxy acid dehydrogenase YdfG
MLQPTAMVTGATEGIGRAIALALGKAGYRVGACARTPSRLRTLDEEFSAAGITAAVFPADVGEPGDVAAAIKVFEEKLGPPDVVVMNAGIAVIRPIEDITLEDWDSMMATNLRSLYLVTRAVLPGMRARRRGSLVLISSLAGKNGFAGGTAYAATKHGLMGFARSLMLEVRRDNIRVISICPGSVDTPLLREGGEMLKPNFDKILQPEDVAATVLAALSLPDRALISEVEVRPTNP